MSDTDWRDDAACTGMDAMLWGAGPEGMDSSKKQLDRGRAICNTQCPAKDACLRDAMRTEPADPKLRVGIRGGLDGDERAALQATINRKGAAPVVTSGPVRLPADEHERRHHAAETYSDNGTAAREVGISTSAFRSWRKRYYSDQKTKTYVLTAAENAFRLNAHAQGMTDEQIATLCGANKWAITKWRRRRDLPSNNPPRRKVTA